MWWLLGAWAAAGAFPYEVVSRTLDNGVAVHVVPMPSPGVVTFGTWMSVGSRDEVDPGRTGFAHFFEHLMFLGTPTLSGADRERALLRMGAEDNAWTWLDETVYHVTLPASDLETVIRMEADRFQHLQLTAEQVRREAGAVYGEFRKGRSNPDELLDEALHAAAFGVHTYGHSTIGYEADIQAMPEAWSYAGQFFASTYRPDRARVVVVGDVDPAAALAWVEAAYGSWRPAADPPRGPVAEPDQTVVRRVSVPWPQAVPPRLRMGWRIPGSRPDDVDVVALSLVEQLLLSEVGSLRRRLVDDLGLAYTVGGGREDFVDPCLFVVAVDLKPGADVAQVEAIVQEEIARLRAGLEATALARLKQHARYAFLSALDEPAQVFMAFGWAARRGGPDAVDRWFETFDRVGADEVAGAARRYLVDGRLTVATLVGAP
jgi:zinc protease